MKLKDKIIFTFMFIGLIISFSFVMINQYKYSKIKKEELTVISEIYSSGKKVKNFYEISCESGNEYLMTYILADDEHIDSMNPGDIIVLSVDGNKVIELEVNGQKIINIEDCHQRYNKQFKTSLIVFPIIFVFIALIILGMNILMKKIESDSRFNSNIEINKAIDQKVYKNMQESIYEQNGYLRCNILEQIECDELTYTFYKAMLDYINERELVLLIDDSCLDDGIAMVFYKDNDKLYFNHIFRDEKEPFEIEGTLFWYYPFNAKVTKEEQNAFNLVVDEYIRDNSEMLKLIK